MPAAFRKGDMTTNHIPPMTFAGQGSQTVFINGMNAVTVGMDYTGNHLLPLPPYHRIGTASMGSQTVFIEGQALHRTNDMITCTDIAGQGSTDVFVDGS